MTANMGSALLSCQIHQVAVALHNIAVILGLVGQKALGTVLDAVLGIGEAAAALVAQGVQGAVAEQTVEGIGIVGGMAGEELALFMLEEGVLFTFPIGFVAHNDAPFGISVPSIPLYRAKVKRGYLFSKCVL
jgi:hypothetical protein